VFKFNHRITAIILVFVFAISCQRSNPVGNLQLVEEDIYGVWKNSEPLENYYLIDSWTWIPNNLHIGISEGKGIRFRILDPIACTDNYPKLSDSVIEFEHIDFYIKAVFKSEYEGILYLSNADTSLNFDIHKTDQDAYWGMCD